MADADEAGVVVTRVLELLWVPTGATETPEDDSKPLRDPVVAGPTGVLETLPEALPDGIGTGTGTIAVALVDSEVGTTGLDVEATGVVDAGAGEVTAGVVDGTA